MADPARTHLRVVLPEVHPEAPTTIGEILHTIQSMKARNAWDEMIQAFHPLGERHPGLPPGRDRDRILQEIAFALSQRKRFAEAIEILMACQDANPGQYSVVAALAFNHYNALMSDKIREINLGERRDAYVEAALNWFPRAEALYPASIVDFYRHGMVHHHIQSNQDVKACPLFERAVANWEALSPQERERRHKDHKNYIKSLYHLAKARLRLGRHAEAEEAARRCMEADQRTDHEEPIHKFYLLGKILLEAGRAEEALGHLRTAAHVRTQKPKDYVYYALAQCLCRLDRWQEALEWLDRIPPRFRKPHIKRLMGWILYRLGDGERAGQVLDQALREDTKGRHLTLLVMGRVLEEIGRLKEAVDCYGQANDFKRKQFLNDHDEALYRMGLCLGKLGDDAGAREAFRRTLLANERHEEAARAMREISGAAASEYGEGLPEDGPADNQHGEPLAPTAIPF